MAKYYIDREGLIAWLKRIPLKDLSDGLGLCRVIMEDDFKKAIKNMPKDIIVDAVPVSELKKLRDYLYAEDLIFMRGLAELNKLIASYGAKHGTGGRMMDVREKSSNEKRLIDANALMDVIRQHEYRLATKQGSIDYGMFTLGIQQAVDEQTTVDAVEVVHGRWEEMHYEGGILDGTNFDRCSVCGYERVFEDPAFKIVFKYCPSCGATMDEKE